MNQHSLNKKRKNCLLNPSAATISEFISLLEELDPELHEKASAFFDALGFTSVHARGEHTMQTNAAKRDARNKTYTTSTQASGGLKSKSKYLHTRASSQWSFINGLGDIEWIQGMCARECLEDFFVHPQALPNIKTFILTITGRFSQVPAPKVSAPFHSISYRVNTIKSSSQEDWDCHTYQCDTLRDSLDNVDGEVYCEILFGVAKGDYVREVSCCF